MDAAHEIHQESVARHKRGWHSWQAGPVVAGHMGLSPRERDTPTTVILVCSCGVIRRVAIPKEIGRMTPKGDVLLRPTAALDDEDLIAEAEQLIERLQDLRIGALARIVKSEPEAVAS